MLPGCQFKKSNGEKCNATPQAGKRFCVFHDPARANQLREARRAGGIARSRASAVLPAGTPDIPLLAPADIVTLVAITANQVRRGQINTAAANCIGYLCSVALRAMEHAPIERRLARIEAALGLCDGAQQLQEGQQGLNTSMEDRTV